MPTLKSLETSAVSKYGDVLDTILVIEAMRNNRGNGKSLKELKEKYKKQNA
ncbi:hypothetical protein HON22_02585 [Candidatus Peregrinibacteria bacterium]|jgi:hypothetical protein|nr:hypothetical protein [Candidatus Peregrinibacteria bacterium]